MSTVIDHPLGVRRLEVDRDFDDFDALLRGHAAAYGKAAVFKTDVVDLFDAYLSGFDDPVERQYHNCSCCRHFLNHFASLAVLDRGQVVPFMLGMDAAIAPQHFQEPLRRMQARMVGAKVVSRFFSSGTVLGSPRTGDWTHFWVTNAAPHMSRTETAGQAMAKSREEFKMLTRAVLEFDAAIIARAAALLVNAQKISSDKFRGHLDALTALKASTDAAPDQRSRDAHIWQAIATNGSAFAHVRSAAIGLLLGDLAGGMGDQAALNRFTAAVDPMAYMRATAPPKAGNIARAEDIIAKLGLAASLARRYASVDEVLGRAAWKPAGTAGTFEAPAPAPAAGGVFAGLAVQAQPKAADVLGVKASMTWEKFARTILPRATFIELVVPIEASYGALTTAADPDAPPLFAWDQDDKRDPLSWYRWNATESASFGITGMPAVTAVVPLPSSLHPGVILLLAGTADSRADKVGIGLFPDLLRSVLREVRSTLFAHSLQQKLAPAPSAPAAGLVLRRGFTKAVLRTTVGGVATDYAIQGWE